MSTLWGSCLCGGVRFELAIGILTGAELIRTFRLSAVDDPFEGKPTKHIYVRSVAPWEALPDDGLERFETRSV